MSQPKFLFVTGKLAEPALRRILSELAPNVGFDFAVAVLPISVASLATTNWIARHLHIPEEINRVIIPGLCLGSMDEVTKSTRVRVDRGPKDLRDLCEYFGTKPALPTDVSQYDIEILAEINHAPRLSRQEILDQATAYRSAGADVIDIGCDPGDAWEGVAEVVGMLRKEGFRVSIDSFNAREVDAAVHAGAELVLSVNSSNRKHAPSWGCEVVAIPDTPANLDGLDETLDALSADGVPFRIDPVIEPIGFGFAASLGRYLEVRRRYPDAEMFMGIGNITELTEVDSAGVNVMLMGFCQEVGIRSVLTTQVINWCRSAVQELDLARRLVRYACKNGVIPKHIMPELVTLRDPKLLEHGEETLSELARTITDPNFRLFAERGLLHLMNHSLFLQGTDPFDLFKRAFEQAPIDSSHAFYLGYESAKAAIALALGKTYVQDQALRWGFLTQPEQSHGGKMPEARSKILPDAETQP